MRNAIRNFARFPNVVGTHWFQYCDEPLGGREDGEDYNMGLIDLANRPYEEVTEVFRQGNPKLDEIHRESGNRNESESAPQKAGESSVNALAGAPPAKPQSRAFQTQHPALNKGRPTINHQPSTIDSQHSAPSTQHSALQAPSTLTSTHPQHSAPSTQHYYSPYPVIRATRPIKVTDQSLMDWDKERTRLLDFQAPPPYVPFGDVHLAWAPEGLYLATLANTFVDPEFLAYQGEFPLAETFQIHLQVGSSGKVKHYGIHLIPQPNAAFPDGFEVKPYLYRYAKGRPAERLLNEGKLQRIEKSLPHMVVEAFFPAEWFGVKELRAGLKLQMNIQVMSYYREFIMSWAGAPQLQPTKLSESLREIVLQESGN